MNNNNKDIEKHIAEHKKVFEEITNGDVIGIIQKIADEIVKAFKSGRKIIFMGNGGSAADAQHLAAEFTGRYLKERKPLPAIALNTNSSAVTAISNDYSYDMVFERQTRAFAKKGDILIGFSTSGKSRNVINAFETGKKIGTKNVAFIGKNRDDMTNKTDYIVSIPSEFTPVIQEMHIMLGHLMCNLIENKLV